MNIVVTAFALIGAAGIIWLVFLPLRTRITGEAIPKEEDAMHDLITMARRRPADAMRHLRHLYADRLPAHIYPIGAREPAHDASAECWCAPIALNDQDGAVYLHHAVSRPAVDVRAMTS